MKTVNMRRRSLLVIVIDNLSKHVEAHARAEDGWQAKQEAALKAALERFKKRRDFAPGRMLVLTKPHSHADDYRRVIAMLKHSVDENVSLTPDEYDSYVRNKWPWAESFNTMTAAYGAKRGKR